MNGKIDGVDIFVFHAAKEQLDKKLKDLNMDLKDKEENKHRYMGTGHEDYFIKSLRLLENQISETETQLKYVMNVLDSE